MQTHFAQTFNKTLSPSELFGVVIAHEIGVGEKGTDGESARIGTYTTSQLARKSWTLKAFGLSHKEVKFLMDKGYVGETIIRYYKSGSQWYKVVHTGDSNTLGNPGYEHDVPIDKSEVPWLVRFNTNQSPPST